MRSFIDKIISEKKIHCQTYWDKSVGIHFKTILLLLSKLSHKFLKFDVAIKKGFYDGYRKL